MINLNKNNSNNLNNKTEKNILNYSGMSLGSHASSLVERGGRVWWEE
jgi:hypothetical protein